MFLKSEIFDSFTQHFKEKPRKKLTFWEIDDISLSKIRKLCAPINISGS